MYIALDDVRKWYGVARDGLRHLETALHAGRTVHISDETFSLVIGMSQRDWLVFLQGRESEHELFASLALLATFEGEIRRDAHWRGSVDRGQRHFHRFQAVLRESHVPIARLIDAWQAALKHEAGMRSQWIRLRDLYEQRNLIAHGSAARGQFAFSAIHDKLHEVHRKWREFVPDFGQHPRRPP